MQTESRTLLAASIQKWGKKFNRETNAEMVGLITKIHEDEKRNYEGVKVEKGIKYGADERQRLDIYYPADATPESELPVVVFFHGGGMVSGDTDVTPLFHSNIGNFFASNATILILATYRLLPLAAHPSGAQDASLAISWATTYSLSYGGSPSKSLTIIGHSAGGSITGTALWGGHLSSPTSPSSTIPPQVLANSTFIFLSAGLWYDVENPPTSINMAKYHRTEDVEKIRREMPVALFREAERETMRGWPKMRWLLSEWEFEEIVRGTEECVEAWEEAFGDSEEGEDGEGDGGLEVEMVWGENHVSYVYGVGTEGSWIGERLLEIVRGEEDKD
ncbi:Alpha/Beta hydrolase protein [Rhexocercosporidium sp. MPI-PUGE-AT-0058]|nr:Alpha/Beta hydrolase protein [Rhexocercosporidium sp. MPI-PUGE-AT-0058]